jgi:hypothetical protein
MKTSKQIALVAAALLAATAPAFAQAQQDPHHPAGSGQTQQAPAAPAAPQMRGGDMPMMGMMMQMMHGGGMGMSAEAMPGMHMADRVEGRLAFLKTELKITEAQAEVWNGFAAALRNNANKLGEVRKAAPAGTAPSLVAQLGQQETWYAARLDGIRAIKAAAERLYPALSESQRETANQLMPAHLGMGSMGGMAMGGMPMGMSMMGGGKP